MEKEEKDKIVEAEVKSVTNDQKPAEKKKGKKSKKVAVFVLILILLAAATGLVIWAAQTGKLDFIFNPKSDTSQIELKRTESVAVKSDGVYVTDVSDVVDAVMPSIVAITSKR